MGRRLSLEGGPPQAPGPSADVQAAQNLTPEQRIAMINGMVGRSPRV